MPDTRLIIVDPGHFHVALVQKEMYPSLSAEAHVYAPLGPDLIDYLGRIARFNARLDQPTRWSLAVHAANERIARGRSSARHRSASSCCFARAASSS